EYRSKGRSNEEADDGNSVENFHVRAPDIHPVCLATTGKVIRRATWQPGRRKGTQSMKGEIAGLFRVRHPQTQSLAILQER
ncbi:MAG TPA: hypothetical protein VIH22_15375, partial [Cyclobacteriaceae bacterium]